MVQTKVVYVFLAVMAVIAIGALTYGLKDTLTGSYYAPGGGRWYYGAQRMQMQPDEACLYSGYEPLYPWRVYTNEYGTMLSLCRFGDKYVGVPVWQTAIVPSSQYRYYR